jgi:hypothetical protein
MKVKIVMIQLQKMMMMMMTLKVIMMMKKIYQKKDLIGMKWKKSPNRRKKKQDKIGIINEHYIIYQTNSFILLLKEFLTSRTHTCKQSV